MPNRIIGGLVIAVSLIGPAMAQERILISSDWGEVTAELADNNATRALTRRSCARGRARPKTVRSSC